MNSPRRTFPRTNYMTQDVSEFRFSRFTRVSSRDKRPARCCASLRHPVDSSALLRVGTTEKERSRLRQMIYDSPAISRVCESPRLSLSARRSALCEITRDSSSRFGPKFQQFLSASGAGRPISSSESLQVVPVSI